MRTYVHRINRYFVICSGAKHPIRAICTSECIRVKLLSVFLHIYFPKRLKLFFGDLPQTTYVGFTCTFTADHEHRRPVHLDGSNSSHGHETMNPLFQFSSSGEWASFRLRNRARRGISLRSRAYTAASALAMNNCQGRCAVADIKYCY